VTLVDLEDQIGSKKNMNTTSYSSMSKIDDQESNTKEKVVLLNPEEFLLQYGPKTLNNLKEAIVTSFKLFWDGSISMYQDTAFSSTNNKEFLTALLDMRTNTEQDEEPPVTLIHGSETE
jgi:3-phosphoglycerate kinase